MGTKIVRAALENGEVDLYWEYTGTSLITFNKVMERLSPEETYSRVKELDGEKGLVWLAPSAANNTYAYVIKPDNAKTEGMGSSLLLVPVLLPAAGRGLRRPCSRRCPE